MNGATAVQHRPHRENTMTLKLQPSLMMPRWRRDLWARFLQHWRAVREPPLRTPPRRSRCGLTLFEAAVTLALAAAAGASVMEVARQWAEQENVANEVHALADAVELAASHARGDLTRFLCQTHAGSQGGAIAFDVNALDNFDDVGRTLTQIRGGTIRFALYRPSDNAADGRLLVVAWAAPTPGLDSYILPVPQTRAHVGRRGGVGQPCAANHLCGPTMNWDASNMFTMLGTLPSPPAVGSLVAVRQLSFEADRDPFLHRVRLTETASWLSAAPTACSTGSAAHLAQRAAADAMNRVIGDFDLGGGNLGNPDAVTPAVQMPTRLLVNRFDVNGHVVSDGDLAPESVQLAGTVTASGSVTSTTSIIGQGLDDTTSPPTPIRSSGRFDVTGNLTAGGALRSHVLATGTLVQTGGTGGVINVGDLSVGDDMTIAGPIAIVPPAGSTNRAHGTFSAGQVQAQTLSLPPGTEFRTGAGWETDLGSYHLTNSGTFGNPDGFHIGGDLTVNTPCVGC